MRVPYAPTEAPSDSPQTTKDIYSRIAARRAPRPLIPLDLALLHNPAIADGWNSLLGAIRSKTTLDDGIVELAVCRVAVLNGASYEWQAHSPLARKGGVSREALQHVLHTPCLVATNGQEKAEGSKDHEALSARQWAVLEYTDAMTRNVDVEGKVFENLKTVAGFNETQCVEMTAVVAGYNCVSRFLVALNVGECNGKGMEVPE